MSERRMDIFLLATPQAGIEHAVLVSNLSAAFKKDAAAIEKMLSRPRTMVKGDVTPDIAAKYKVLIEKSGGQCELVVRESAAVSQVPAAAASVPVHGAAPVDVSLATVAPAVMSPVAAPIPAVTPVPEAPPELTSVVEQAPVSAPAEAEAIGQTEVYPQADTAPAAAFEQDVAAQLQAWAGYKDDESLGDQQYTPAPGEAAQEQDEGAVDHSDTACYCVRCGTRIRLDQIRCPSCLTPVIGCAPKNKIAASLLALFVGGFGLHRLYLGQWWGIIYLVFWFTLIPSIVSIVEAVVFWLTPQKKWDAQYGLVQKTSPWLAALFVLVFIALFSFIGMVAAIVIPSYHDYGNRAKIQGSMPLVQESLDKVAAFIKQNQTYPGDNQAVGLSEQSSSEFIESISVQPGAIVQVVYRLSGLKEKNSILWIPTENKGEITWDCKRGTLPDQYRPLACRSGDVPANSELERVAAETVLSQKLYSEDKHISLLVPVTWEAKELLPAAAIGAAKLLDENYVVVLADTKANFDENLTLADYSRTVQLQLADNIKNGMVQGDVEYLTVGGFPAEQFIFPGVVGGVKIAYVVTLIQGDTHFYRVLAWTLQTRMEQNKKLLKSISESIKIQ